MTILSCFQVIICCHLTFCCNNILGSSRLILSEIFLLVFKFFNLVAIFLKKDFLVGEKSKDNIEFSIIIPAYNEEDRIEKTLKELKEFLENFKKSTEVIFVDDGSRDKTREILSSFAKLNTKCLVSGFDKNQGKGASIKLGVQLASGKLIAFCDADASTPFSEFLKLQDSINSGFDIVIGSRRMPLEGEQRDVSAKFLRKFAGDLFSFIVRLIALKDIYDSQCGFKAFKSDAAKTLFSLQTAMKFSFDVEILMLAKKHKYRIKEVPVKWVQADGSKINLLKDSWQMLIDVISFRLKGL